MLDATDKKLINLLQHDGKQTTKQLSLQLNLSVTAVYERIKKLENNEFEIDKSIQNKLLITVAPDGYLKRVK